MEEIGTGDPVAAQKRVSAVEEIPILEATENATKLAKTLILKNAVPETSIEDALHIALATIQGTDFLLTWNFKHINNANTRDKIHEMITQLGYKCPVLCSPEELINEE